MAAKPPVGIKVEGLAPLNRKLKELDDKLPNEVRELNRRAALTALPVIRPLVPVSTLTEARKGRAPHLVDTLRVGATRRSGYVAIGNVRTPYTAPVHWGWPAHHITANRFMVEGAGRVEPAVVEEYERGLEALLARTGLS